MKTVYFLSLLAGFFCEGAELDELGTDPGSTEGPSPQMCAAEFLAGSATTFRF
jgi:hypothetical protein